MRRNGISRLRCCKGLLAFGMEFEPNSQPNLSQSGGNVISCHHKTWTWTSLFWHVPFKNPAAKYIVITKLFVSYMLMSRARPYPQFHSQQVNTQRRVARNYNTIVSVVISAKRDRWQDARKKTKTHV